MELATPMTQGCDSDLITWISANNTDWTPEVKYHLSWIMAEKISMMRRTSRSLVVQGFIGSFFMLCFTYVSNIVMIMKIFSVQPTIREWEYAWASTRRLVTNPSHRTTNKHGETRYRLNGHEERCNRKRIHSHFLKRPKLQNARGPELLGLHARDAQVKPYLEQQNLGKIENRRAQSLNWDLWIGKQSPIRYRGKIWQLKDLWWNRTSQDRHWNHSWSLALICEVDHGIIGKVYVDTSPFNFFWHCWMKVCWDRSEVLCITVAVRPINGQNWLKRQKNYRPKLNETAE